MIYAGAEVVLAIVERPGRSPVSLSFTRDPIIAWRSADGVDEFIELQGTHGSVDFQALMSHKAAVRQNGKWGFINKRGDWL